MADLSVLFYNVESNITTSDTWCMAGVPTRGLAKIGSRALYLELRDTFKILFNDYVR